MGRDAINVAGLRFGMLTAIRPTEKRNNRQVVWEWKCDCGNIVEKPLGWVRQNHRKGFPQSCGCMIKRNIEGNKFGKLTAIRPTEKRYHYQVVWEWKCDCGNIIEKPLGLVMRGKNPNCGCLSRANYIRP